MAAIRYSREISIKFGKREENIIKLLILEFGRDGDSKSGVMRKKLFEHV